jgi:hypothetical protein
MWMLASATQAPWPTSCLPFRADQSSFPQSQAQGATRGGLGMRVACRWFVACY